MLWITLLLAAISSTGLSARRQRFSYLERTSQQPNVYVFDICEEKFQFSEPTRPCETMFAIQYQCSTGMVYEDNVDVQNQTEPDCSKNDTCQSFEFERTCLCQSQFHDSANGCNACWTKHGGEIPPWVADSAVLPSVMSEYCDPEMDPTAGFEDYMRPVWVSSPESTSTTKFVDPLGFKLTDVSLYYTPYLTGLKAWVTQLSTIEGWSSDAIETSSSISSTSVSTNGSTDRSTSISTHYSSSTVTPTSAAQDTTITSTSFSTTSMPVSTITPTVYSTVYSSPTSRPSLAPTTSTSPEALKSIVGVVGILSFVAIVGFL